MYIFSTRWINMDVQGVKSKVIDGLLRTESEEEAELLRKNKSFVEVTHAFQPKVEPEPKPEVVEEKVEAPKEIEEPKSEEVKPEDEAMKTIEVMRKRRPKIVVGARLVQEEKE